MTEAEKGVKALIEKTVADAAKVAAQLEAEVAQLQAEVERKNKTLEGYIAENEALKKELVGQKAEGVTAASDTQQKERHIKLNAELNRWRTNRKVTP